MTPPHPLTNFEIQGYYQNEPRFNGVFSRDNLPNTIKNGAKRGERAYVINLDEYHDIGTHWVALYVNNKTATYSNGAGTFKISDTKIYVPVVTLSTQENAKLLQQLK